MKLSELKRVIDFHASRHGEQSLDELEVKISIAKPSIGPSAAVQVDSCGAGMDWDHNTFFITPSVRLSPKGESEEVYDMVKDLVMWIATKRGKRVSYEVDCCRRILTKRCVDFMKYQDFCHPKKEVIK